jgi:hypothetical protein
LTANFDETRYCPIAARCEVCAAVQGIRVCSVRTRLGTLCLTLCARHAVTGAELPQMRRHEVRARVTQHARHTDATPETKATTPGTAADR